MKMQICGIEVSEGISKKTGKPYSMGSLHTLVQLAPPLGSSDNIAKGSMGSTYECDPILLRKFEHLVPCMAEVELGAQMRYGERKEIVVDVRPVERVALAKGA